MPSRTRLPALELALACASVLAALALPEAGLRLSGWVPAAYPGSACIFDPGRTLLLDCYPTNPRGSFDVDLRDPATLERYRRQRVKRLDRAAGRAPFAVEVRYNAHGWRGSAPGPRLPGVRRVAVMGDSFTEGQGVKEQETLPLVLHGLLARRAPGRFEVLNCGRRASDFPELRSELDEVLQLAPDLVVYAMVPNDAEAGPDLRRRFAELADLITDRRQGDLAWDYQRLQPADSRLLALLRGRLQASRLRRESLRAYRDLYSPANAEGWGRTQRYLREMASATQARRVRFVVALWPLLVGLDSRYPLEGVHAEVRASCARAGIEFLDLLPALRGRAAEELWVHPIDHHPNELAQRLAAERLAPEVLRLLPRATGGS